MNQIEKYPTQYKKTAPNGPTMDFYGRDSVIIQASKKVH